MRRDWYDPFQSLPTKTLCNLHMLWLRTTPKSMLCHQKSTKHLLYLEKKLLGQFGRKTAAAAAFRITWTVCTWSKMLEFPHYTPQFCAICSLTLNIIYLQIPTLSPSTMLLLSFLVFSTQFLSQPYVVSPFMHPK